MIFSSPLSGTMNVHFGETVAEFSQISIAEQQLSNTRFLSKGITECAGLRFGEQQFFFLKYIDRPVQVTVLFTNGA